jgi:PAS domain S-box-containing protein
MTASDFIIEHCPDGILSVSAKGIILSVNPAAEKILAWPKDKLIGKSIGVLIPGHERRRHSQRVRQFAGNPSAYRQMSSWRQVEALRGDGRTIPVTVWLANESSAGETRTTVFLLSLIHI